VEDIFGVRRIEIAGPAADKFEVVVNWKGEMPSAKPAPEVAPAAPEKIEAFDWSKNISAGEKFEDRQSCAIFQRQGHADFPQ
jgi:invasion protein IalB